MKIEIHLKAGVEFLGEVQAKELQRIVVSEIEDLYTSRDSLDHLDLDRTILNDEKGVVGTISVSLTK